MVEVVDVATQDELITKSTYELGCDICAGFNNKPKQISAKYFYDEYGSELFDLITRHPDYYLTAAELEILNTYKSTFTAWLRNDIFNLIELGPGEGIKTKIFLEQFEHEKRAFNYLPVDISKKYLQNIANQFESLLNSMTLINTDYFDDLTWIKSHSDKQNFVLFLGSSIGNFSLLQAEQFFKKLHDNLNAGDLVLIGFDLRKEIETLMRAYNDSDGLTRAFNFNLLARLNRELYADFNLDKFKHYPTYNFYTNAMESFLVSVTAQRVNFAKLNQSYFFDEFEPIHVESSHKYSMAQIEQFAQVAGFEVAQHYFDSRRYFVDSLWRVKK